MSPGAGGVVDDYAALARLAPTFRLAPSWTAGAALPGGDVPHDGIDALVRRARGLWPFLAETNASRMVRAYGTRLDRVLGEAKEVEALGERFGDALTAAEVRYLMRHEFAETADDVLWRRSKLGLRTGAEDAARLGQFMQSGSRQNGSRQNGRSAAAE